MNIYKIYLANAVLRVAMKSVIVALLATAAIVCAVTGYGLLKVLVQAIKDDAELRIAEVSTHSTTMLAFFVLAGLCVYLAKRAI